MSFKVKLLTILFAIIVVFFTITPLGTASSWGTFYVTKNNPIDDVAPSLAIYKGKAYVVFVLSPQPILWGTEPSNEIYLRTNSTGVWSSPRRLTNNSAADFAPDIAVDPNGRLHIAYLYANPKTGGDFEVVYKTNVSGRWTTKTLTNTPNDEGPLQLP